MKSMTFDQSTIMSDPNNNGSSSLAGSMAGSGSPCSSINSPISNIGASSSSSNNSKKPTNEKYSLRQRQKRQTGGSRSAATVGGGGGGGGATIPCSSSVTLKDVSCDQQPVVGKDKPKSKAAPLSKYRRKTANARERTRMREINSAFENLRQCVPHSLGGGGRNSPTTTNEKLTKITTLRLAMKYIRTLSEALTNPAHDVSYLFNPNNNSNMFENSNPASDILSPTSSNFDSLFSQSTSDELIMPPVKVQRATSSKITSRSRQKAKQKAESTNMDIDIATPSACFQDNPADLGLLLESDGESLHLSEPCLSPLGQNMKPFNCNPSSDSGLELGLLLESDSDSLQFSEPCLSPLGALDAFNPFGDLLHPEFTEQTSLDMYLT